MRKMIFLLTVILSLHSCLQTGHCRTVEVNPQQAASEIKVLSTNQSSLQLQFNFHSFEVATVRLADRDFDQLTFEGNGSWGNFGQPELPVLSKLVRLPDRTGWNWEIISDDYFELDGYSVNPFQEGSMETPDGPFEPEVVFDEEIYNQDRWFPEEPVGLGSPIIMGGFRLGKLELRPILFNPAQGKLRVYRSISVQITFNGDADNKVINSRSQKSRIFSRLIHSTVLNPDVFDTEEGELLGGYLFIAPPNFFNSIWLDNLVEWKRQKGYPCTVLSTSTTGTTASAIKNYIQNNVYNIWEIPPEFLVLVGDADQGVPTHTYSPTGNCSDLPYTLLEGDDYFPDMLAGRLSVDNDFDLSIVCSKTVNYESNPYTYSTDWFKKGLMVYDYSGSQSCLNVKQRCSDLMMEYGYDQVQHITNYASSSQINNAINAGITFVNYRGYGSYSSWSPPYYNISNIAQLNNGYKLPVITSIVCGGGNFVSSSYDPCFGEAWIRYGNSPANPKGAVAFMGPSSLYTHTRWNNCIDGGIYQGLFKEDIRDFASALLRGKIELYYGMPNNLGSGSTTTSVECYFYVYNILGDPGLQMWTDVPADLTVAHPASLALGVNYLEVAVDISGVPQEDALVGIYCSDTGSQFYTWTDENGVAAVDLTGAAAGSYSVTVTGHNLYPYHGTLDVSQQAIALGISEFTIDDDMTGESSGDDDGEVNPGETIELIVILGNNGSSTTATSINGTVSSSDPFVTITQSTLTGPNASPGGTSPLNDDFNLVFSNEAPHSRVIPILLEASCSQGSWTNLINLSIVAPLAEAVEYEVLNTSGILEPGEMSDVAITLLSSGGDPLLNCTGTLTSPDNFVTVLDGSGSWGDILQGSSSSNDADPFNLHADPSCPPGWTVSLELIVTAGSYIDTVIVPFTVGRVEATDPAGPDEYGYRCFDSRDINYEQIPTYQWLEASAQPGQETLPLPDYGSEDDCSVARPLPFTFRYYGQDYDEITICSNGWLSMGDMDYYHSLRNWNIPGALGPPAMIAAFWDDLRLQYGGSVHYFYDFLNYRVVVEWKDAQTACGSGVNTFEIFLYDPNYVACPTGAGVIEFQYHTFNNVDYNENYATIGIENWDQSDGVKVTYDTSDGR